MRAFKSCVLRDSQYCLIGWRSPDSNGAATTINQLCMVGGSIWNDDTMHCTPTTRPAHPIQREARTWKNDCRKTIAFYEHVGWSNINEAVNYRVSAHRSQAWTNRATPLPTALRIILGDFFFHPNRSLHNNYVCKNIDLISVYLCFPFTRGRFGRNSLKHNTDSSVRWKKANMLCLLIEISNCRIKYISNEMFALK